MRKGKIKTSAKQKEHKVEKQEYLVTFLSDHIFFGSPKKKGDTQKISLEIKKRLERHDNCDKIFKFE